MRTAVAALLVLSGLLSMAVAEARDEAKADSFRDLGEQFVNALKNEDVVEFSQCWMSFRRLKAVALAAKLDIPEEQLEAMKKYFEDRNQHVVYAFNVLTKMLKKEGDLEQLTLVKVSGKISEKNGMRQTSMFYIVLSLGATKFQVDIDDGFEENGAWYFSDKPLYVRNLSTDKLTHLQEPDRQADEKRKRPAQ